MRFNFCPSNSALCNASFLKLSDEQVAIFMHPFVRYENKAIDKPINVLSMSEGVISAHVRCRYDKPKRQITMQGNLIQVDTSMRDAYIKAQKAIKTSSAQKVAEQTKIA